MRISWPSAVVVLLLAGGCGPEAPRLAPVRGRVYYRGSPLPGGTLVFTPDPVHGNSGPQARAEIKPDGSYDLRTAEAPGAVPGWHRVTVVAVEVPQQWPEGPHFVVPRSLLPSKYRDPEMSGLVADVKPGQDNRIDFHLH